MPEIPPQVIDLVQRFERNVESYRSQGYNETQLRREFIDPFFEALGWDVTNKQGYAEATKTSSTRMQSGLAVPPSFVTIKFGGNHETATIPDPRVGS